MTKPWSLKFATAISILFACSAIPAFANHGGGGGGGGFHGGGGGGSHGGGGGGSVRSSGGGFRGAAPRSGGNDSRGTSAAPSRSYGNSLGNSVNGNQRAGNSFAPAAGSGGQWHSFGNSTGNPAGPSNRGASGAALAQAGSSGAAGSGWHVFSSNRAAGATGSTGAVRSFSGQGGEVWENSPSSRNVVSQSRTLSNLQSTMRSPLTGSTALRGNTSLSASNRFAGGSAFTGNRSLIRPGGPVNSIPLRSTFRTGFPFGFHGRCWNCGFGFGGFGGFGGWGLGWGGFGFWDPFWFDPWWGPGPAYGYGYFGYPYGGVYGYLDPNGYYQNNYPGNDPNYQNYNANPPMEQRDQGGQGGEGDQSDQQPVDGNWVTPNGPNPSAPGYSASLNVPVLIYLKSGAVYTVRDYWMMDGELHMVLVNGAENAIDLEQVDLPRTNTENAKSGVKFIFKSQPNLAPVAPGGNNMPPAKSVPSPTQPEART